MRIAGEIVDRAVGCEAAQVVVAAPVLADHQVAPRRDRKIVAQVERVCARALVDERQHVRRAIPARRKLPDLPGVIGPALRTVEEMRALSVAARTVGEPFPAREHRRACREAALAQVAFGRFDIVEIDPANGHRLPRLDPLGRTTAPVARIVACVGAVATDNGKGLKATTRGELAALVRDEAIEQPFAIVFGQIDDAAFGIDRHRFMGEAAHGGQRDGIDRTSGTGRHFEDEAVGPLRVLFTDLERLLLAGQPAAPWRRSARAIRRSAEKRDVVAHDFAGCRVDDDIGRAAEERITLPPRVVDARSIEVGERF